MIMQENSTDYERNGFISILTTYVTVGIVLLFSLAFVFTLSTVNAQEHGLDLKQIIDPCTMPDHSLHLSDADLYITIHQPRLLVSNLTWRVRPYLMQLVVMQKPQTLPYQWVATQYLGFHSMALPFLDVAP